MDSKDYSSQKDYNFLHDDDFIRWRLFPTDESDTYWSGFPVRYPHLAKAFQEAIMQFNAVKMNRGQLSEKDKVSVYNAIWRNIHRYKRRQLLHRIGATAAVLLIGIVSVLFVSRKQHSVSVPETKTIVGQTLPEEEIYLISGGKKVNIAHNSHIVLIGKGKALVIDSADTQKELLLATTKLNRLVVPYGKRTNLTLSDGTAVWLNSGTQLDFPSEFTRKTREIGVNGEIFIDVTENRNKPFIVHTKEMDIRVLGTSFNVSAYSEDAKETVVLVKGKVKIETADNRTTELFPNEKTVVGVDGKIIKEKVNVSEYISWTKGILEFHETPVPEMLKKIERYYNVQFKSSIDMKLNDKTCSGKLFLSNNLDSVLTSVSVLSSTVYQRENNIIYITKK